MKKFDPTPQKVSAEYQAGVQFNQGIQLYDCVNVNENFFIGKQWEEYIAMACRRLFSIS